MNDWLNDPTECCGEIMEVDGFGNLICDYCGKFVQPESTYLYDTLEEKEECYPVETDFNFAHK